ncbi:uncharacterized protein LOC135812491 [Sycon ciliatum]|uniref:uncharacterized protein LOC135812491 n=1 Tax=Sycon ciliatum TaxID=27933 RepID=UPI0031F6A1D9
MTTAMVQLAEVLAERLPVANAQTQPAESHPSDLQRMVARQSVGRDLPNFSGNPATWPMFHHMYRVSTQECGFSNHENMARLQKALSGKAKEAVMAMLVIPDNVDRVIRTLETRFGQPEQVIQTIIDNAQKQRAVKEEDFEALIDLANAVGNLVATMQLMESTGHITNPALRQEIVSKLPSSLRRLWGEHIRTRDQEVTLETLAEWLEERADAVSRVKRPAMFPADSAKRPTFHRGSTFAATEKQCAFCKRSGHATRDCRTFAKKSVNDRWKWIRAESRCFTCLAHGHRSGNCPSKKPCGLQGCDRLHHHLLHPAKRPDDTRTSGKNPDQPNTSSQAVEGHTYLVGKCNRRDRVILRTVPVTIRGPSGEVRTSALLDEASTVTLMDAAIAKEIGAEGPRRPLFLTWTDDSNQTDKRSQSVRVEVEGDGGTFSLDNVRTVSKMDLPEQQIDVPKLSSRWPHLADSPKIVGANTKPRLLIGQDNCHLILPREVIEGPPSAPMMTKCKLGWSVHGNDRAGVPQIEHCHLARTADDDLHQLVKESFSTESFGVKVTSNKTSSREEVRAERLLESTTKRVGTRWETGLLWRSSDIALPESYEMAKSRLMSLERKMDRNPAYADQYCSKIAEYVATGYARKLTEEELDQDNVGRRWYLPHFGVVNPNKPGKIRLVFDAAAKSNGMSLNDALVSGPDLLNPLPSVLFKFRQHRIGFGGDIQQMFHQVLIRKEDLPAQRFLWRGRDRGREPDVMQMTAMTFGATCSPAAAQYVMRKNASEFTDRWPDAVRAICENHYVDDYYDSTDDEEQARNRVDQVSAIHDAGGFLIRHWVSNSRELLQHIPAERRAVDAPTFNSGTELPMERALGLKWDPETDQFNFRLSQRLVDQEAKSPRPTKRQALRMIMSVFDPMGFLSCHTLAARVLLQDVWRTGVGWDQPLPDSLLEKWRQWWGGLRELSHIVVPRCYCLRMSTRKSCQLHVFGDASEDGFAAVAYFRTTLEDRTSQVSFVLGKSRVAPLRPISIPRLELQAALMAARIARTVLEGHDLLIDSTTLWTDSITVLRWIQADASKPFVAHRVGEIDELSAVSQWRWMPTTLNPADAATRVLPDVQGRQLHWLQGPKFLQAPEADWPEETTHAKATDVDADEGRVCRNAHRARAVGLTRRQQLFIVDEAGESHGMDGSIRQEPAGQGSRKASHCWGAPSDRVPKGSRAVVAQDSKRQLCR